MADPTTRRVPRAYASARGRTPSGVRDGQYVADPQADDVVVFIIGMRINRLRKVRSWWPAFVAMPRMLRELAQADRGLLGVHSFWAGRVFLTVQYWRSAAELGAFARDASMSHAPAWRAFNKDAAATGDVGIFHETYVVPKDRIESLYGNMPAFGLAQAVGSVERGSGRLTSAHERLDSTQPDYVDAPA
jgi:fumigallin biosynthesis monooxygenase-like protein